MLQAETEGIVIRTYPFRDSDLIVRVITPQKGKLGLFARGARKSKRSVCRFDLFDSGTFRLDPRSRGSLHGIKEFTPKQRFPTLSSSFDKLTIASLLCETADLLTPDELVQDDQTYTTLKLGLEAIDEAKDLKEAFKGCYFAINHLLNIGGFISNDTTAKPSAKGLSELLDSVERVTERKLYTKESVMSLLCSIRAANRS